MDTPRRRWHLTRSSPVRADAQSLFIPVHDLSTAAVGDVVAVSGPDGNDTRTGILAELTQGQGQRFFRLDLQR